MSNIASLHKAVRKDLFGDLYTETPAFFPNVPEKQRGLTEFVKVFTVVGDGEKENITDTDQIYTGMIMVQVFTTKNKGDVRVQEIADILVTLLIGKELDEGNLFITSVIPIQAEDPTGQYYQMNVEARFMFNYVV